ncbi:MAG: Methionine--tRNA ligase [Mycoplasmataceae bacterium]|nr:MAG: Methionine--tRNA ligase [Mycoplasmataceae bacterium]
MSKKLYITTPIFYPNDKLHLGHAYATTIADIIARYKKSQGYQVYFQTGSDEHGEKIEKKAKSLKITPQELVDKNVELFKELWQKLGINYDLFYRTSSQLHKEKVQQIFQKLLKNDDIYLGKYRGNYCTSCEDYVKEKDCPSCHSGTRVLEESAYFLRVSRYYQQLLEYYRDNPNFLIPEASKKELFANFLQEDKIQDLCITRNDIKWGIPVPNDSENVIYVWFEALCNYLNSTEGKKMFADKGSEIIHLIGKEIVRFHSLYWPVILFALGVRLPNKVIAHGLLLDPQGEKASKSKGNVIDPLELLKNYPQDLLRVYFVAKVNFLQDGVCSEDLLKSFYQDFFVNNLGNLFSRVNKMIHLYNKGVISAVNFKDISGNLSKKELSQKLEEYKKKCELSVREFQDKMNGYEFTKAFSQIQNLLNESNKLITELTPWELFKKGEIDLLNYALNYLANGIKIIAFSLNCIAPETSKKILETFIINDKMIDWSNCLDFKFLNGFEVKVLEKHLFN